MARKKAAKPAHKSKSVDTASPSTTSSGSTGSATATTIPTSNPQFGESIPTKDPTKFSVKHGSDTAAYTILDTQKGKLRPRPFPAFAGGPEPVLTLAQSYGKKGDSIVSDIEKAGQIVFHAVGDTGNTRGPKDQDVVSDKMVSDFDETNPAAVPSFFYHLGDVIYSFGESQYYYDQFYEPYRDYPAPIFAIPGNHDGMVAPNTPATTLTAFLENFCAPTPQHNPEAGGLARTAQIQPGVYFTLDAPFVRILGLYSNCLEDPGIISSQGKQYPELSNFQLDFLEAALTRIKQEKYPGAVIIAVHHPPYVAQKPTSKPLPAGKHGGSPEMLKEIDTICAKTGIWPHAVLSAHAHNYQRFTRHFENRQTPFIIAGNGGHGLTALTKKDAPTIRTPATQPGSSNGKDTVVFENYDDQDFGYLRVLATKDQLRIEYHPSPDGASAKTPDDSVTVDLKTRTVATYKAA